MMGGPSSSPRQVHAGLIGLGLALGMLLPSGCVTGISERDLAAEYFSIGNAYYDLGRYERAAEYYLRALELDPALRRSSYNLARAFLEGSRPDEAVAVLVDLLAEDPENLKVLETLAYTYSLLGRMEESLATYRRILNLSPYRTDALFNAALVAQRMDRVEEAGDLLARAYDLAPEDPDILLRYGMYLLTHGEAERAIPLLEKYREGNPDNVPGAMLLADAYESEDFFSQALEVYDTVIDREPGNSEALFRKARILLTAADDAEEGGRALEQAFQAGYADVDAIRGLLQRPDLVPDPAVRELLAERLEELPGTTEEGREAAEVDGEEPPASAPEE